MSSGPPLSSAEQAQSLKYWNDNVVFARDRLNDLGVELPGYIENVKSDLDKFFYYTLEYLAILKYINIEARNDEDDKPKLFYLLKPAECEGYFDALFLPVGVNEGFDGSNNKSKVEIFITRRLINRIYNDMDWFILPPCDLNHLINPKTTKFKQLVRTTAFGLYPKCFIENENKNKVFVFVPRGEKRPSSIRKNAGELFSEVDTMIKKYISGETKRRISKYTISHSIVKIKIHHWKEISDIAIKKYISINGQIYRYLTGKSRDDVEKYFYYTLEYLALNNIIYIKSRGAADKPFAFKIIEPTRCNGYFDEIFLPDDVNYNGNVEQCRSTIIEPRIRKLGWLIALEGAAGYGEMHSLHPKCFCEEASRSKTFILLPDESREKIYSYSITIEEYCRRMLNMHVMREGKHDFVDPIDLWVESDVLRDEAMDVDEQVFMDEYVPTEEDLESERIKAFWTRIQNGGP